MRRVTLPAVVLLLMAVALVGCGTGPSTVDWRNIVLPVPEGWVVVEVADDRVRFASAAVVDEVPNDGLVLLTVSFQPSTLPDDVRSGALARGVTVESDTPIVVGDEVPATRLVLLDDTVDPATREVVVLVPSRGLVAIGSVVAGPAVTHPAARLLDDLDAILAIIVGASYGAPVLG